MNSGNIPVYGTGGYMLSVNKALSHTDSIGLGRKGTIDKPQFLKAPFWTVDTLFFLTPKEKYSIHFLYPIIQKFNWKKLNEATGVPSLSKKTIENQKEYFPNIDEQNQLGTLIGYVTKTITLQQRQLDLYKKLKKGLLQKLFPKDGERVPEVRFADFTRNWEQRELGSILSYEQPTKYIVKSTQYNNNYKTPVLTAGKSFIIGFTNETTNLKAASNENPVIIFDDFTTSSHLVKFPFKIKSSAMKLLSLSNSCYDINFIFNAMSSINYIAQGHERHWISIFSKFQISLPNFEEQSKIGLLLKKLNKKILSQENKIKNLEMLKEYLLQKLFI